MSDQMLVQIATWAEVGILLFIVWEKYGPVLLGGGQLIARPHWTRAGIGQFLWENRSLVLATFGLILVTWLNLFASAPNSQNPTQFFANDLTVTLEKTYDQRFENQTVVVDGKEFIRCTFTNVTFQTNGDNFKLTESKIFGKRNVVTTSGRISNALLFVKALSAVADPAKGEPALPDK
jgi:hypothetical protein